MNTSHRFSSLLLSPSPKTARNRVVVPAMASQTADAAGFVTDAMMSHYARLSQSGAGIIFLEYPYVHPSGKSEENQLSLAADEHIAGLKRVSAAVQDSGALAGIQLTHSGGKSTELLTEHQLMAPSEISIPVKDQIMEVPRAMTEADIRLWKESFVSAAKRAVLAGFDLVELHAAHGYGLNQWISPLTNHRQDEYGGSPENRSRLLFEIVREIRTALPELILSVRLPGQDLSPGGLTTDDAIEIARGLEKLGVNLIHVSSGIGGWRRPKKRAGEGYLVPEAILIQAEISIPVIGVGGIQSVSYIESVLMNRSLAFVAVGRAILADPVAWKEQILAP